MERGGVNIKTHRKLGQKYACLPLKIMDQLLFSFHSGSAVMGSECSLRDLG